MGTPLHYGTGEEMHIGDRVEADGMVGTVMCVIDSAQFSTEFPEEHWAYLERGFMFLSDENILIHFEYTDECPYFSPTRDAQLAVAPDANRCVRASHALHSSRRGSRR